MSASASRTSDSARRGTKPGTSTTGRLCRKEDQWSLGRSICGHLAAPVWLPSRFVRARMAAAPRLPASRPPLRDRRPFLAQGGVVAVPGVHPRLIRQSPEHPLFEIVEQGREVCGRVGFSRPPREAWWLLTCNKFAAIRTACAWRPGSPIAARGGTGIGVRILKQCPRMDRSGAGSSESARRELGTGRTYTSRQTAVGGPGRAESRTAVRPAPTCCGCTRVVRPWVVGYRSHVTAGPNHWRAAHAAQGGQYRQACDRETR